MNAPAAPRAVRSPRAGTRSASGGGQEAPPRRLLDLAVAAPRPARLAGVGPLRLGAQQRGGGLGEPDRQVVDDRRVAITNAVR